MNFLLVFSGELTNYLRKLQTFTYLHQQNQSLFNVIILKIFKVNKIISYGQTKKQTKLHHENVWKREPFGFVPQRIRLIQPACYAAIVNKASLRNISEHNVHRLIFDLRKHYDIYLERCQSCNTIKAASMSGAHFNMKRITLCPFVSFFFKTNFVHYIFF